MEGVTLRVGVGVEVGTVEAVTVGVATNSANACMVIAPAVFIFEMKESTTSAGCSAMAVATFRSCIAILETEHSRLIPRAPAAITASSPR